MSDTPTTCPEVVYSGTASHLSRLCGREFKTDKQRRALMCGTHLLAANRRAERERVRHERLAEQRATHDARRFGMASLAEATGLTFEGTEFPSDRDVQRLTEWARAVVPFRVGNTVEGVPGERTAAWGTAHVTRIGHDSDGPPRIFVTWDEALHVEDEVYAHEIRRVVTT